MAVIGLTAETYQNLQLNAGVLIHSVDWEGKSKSELIEIINESLSSRKNIIGATRGGSTFNATMNTRSVEIDGERNNYVGSTQLESWDISLETTGVEFEPEIQAAVLPTSEIEKKENGVTMIKVRNDIRNEDYLENVMWIGDKSDGGLIAIVLLNVLNTSGASFTINNDGEGEYSMTWVPHQASFKDQEYAPFRILYLSDISEASGASAAVKNGAVKSTKINAKPEL